jgi:hypothetical protein
LKQDNQILKDSISDLTKLVKVIDSGYDNDSRELIARNKELEAEMAALEQALKISEKNGAHMDKLAGFFSSDPM